MKYMDFVIDENPKGEENCIQQEKDLVKFHNIKLQPGMKN